MKIPIYKMLINDDDDSGVDFIAMVDEPAIKKTWLAFNEKTKFKADKEKRIVSGPLMVADQPIYRYTPEEGEFYVIFDSDNIRRGVEKYFRNGYTGNVNMMHSPEAKALGVYMIESMIIDSSRGIKTPEGFDELPEGSWFGSFKVDNDSIWNQFVKTGQFTGFSVEGLFGREPDISLEERVAKIIN